MIYTCKHCKEEVTDHIINHICDGCYRKLDYYKRLSEAAARVIDTTHDVFQHNKTEYMEALSGWSREKLESHET